MNILKEFKTFAIKGNAIDLAVGVVIGAAFGKIVTSLVDDIINPIIGFLTGNIDFTDKVLRLGNGASEIAIRYGAFITATINFIIVAFAIFLVVKQINKLKNIEEKKPASQKPIVPEDIKLLTEIKDLLARK